ncbi:MAG: hypothetical protein JW950_10845, partial [Deltaproteobacteria bacterium]|nr:hypothetical protein [Deltaproteobacteria bacterium]
NRALQEDQPSMAYYGQRIRLEPVFKVAEGLNFSMRIDAMERVWGQFPVASETNPAGIGALNTRNLMAEQNVQFRRGWMDFISPIGMFVIGYRADGEWGTTFGDTGSEGPMVVYLLPLSKEFAFVAGYEQLNEGRLGDLNGYGPGFVDSDGARWFVAGRYARPNLEIGALAMYVRVANLRPGWVGPLDLGMKMLDTYWGGVYFKSTIGPLYIEAEYENWWGDFIKWDNLANAKALLGAATTDIDLESQQIYLMAKLNMGPAYIGAQYAYSSGDDAGTADTMEGYPSPGNTHWQPCLILFEDWTNRWSGNLGSAGQTTHLFANVHFYQLFGGFNPTPKLGIKAGLAYAEADEKPAAAWIDDEYGTEFDLTVSYKIYDNLEYMIGFGYLWAGDYYKGTSSTFKIDDDYLVMHKLTLTF